MGVVCVECVRVCVCMCAEKERGTCVCSVYVAECINISFMTIMLIKRFSAEKLFVTVYFN